MATHPSEFILEELEFRHWNADELARRSAGDYETNRLAWQLYLAKADPEILLGDWGAQALSAAFGTSPQLWLRLERSWLESLGKR